LIYNTEIYVREGIDKAILELNGGAKAIQTGKSVHEIILSRRGWELPAQRIFVEFDEFKI
jgi:hypothetical protein